MHRTVGSMGLLYTLLVGVWGLVLFLRRQAPGGNFTGALVIAQVLFVIQALVGVVLIVLGRLPAQSVHFLYGICTVLTLPLAYTMTRGRNDSRAALIYGLALLFLWGLAERAVGTALP
ncbi:MAG TPA: hypothetical protein VM536_23025 [Chloroflexia bacterium]|nr:hypothetical protein [Chloroflexia bacterium]